MTYCEYRIQFDGISSGLSSNHSLNVDPLALIILIPLCERFIYPVSLDVYRYQPRALTRTLKAIIRSGVRFDPITRIAAGFLAATIGQPVDLEARGER